MLWKNVLLALNRPLQYLVPRDANLSQLYEIKYNMNGVLRYIEVVIFGGLHF